MRWEILKRRNIALLTAGSLVSYLGTLLQNFALSLYVLKLTGSGTQFASVLAVAMLPRILLGPFMGVLADRLDRKTAIVGLDVLSGSIVGIGAVTYLITGDLGMGMIYFLQLSLTLISVLFEPTISSVVPSIVAKEDLMDVNAVKSVLRTLIEFTAPLLGGLMLGALGLGYIMVFNAVSFYASAFSESFIEVPKRTRRKEALNLKGFVRDFGEGLAFARRKRVILAIVFAGIVLNFSLGGLFEVGMTYVLKETLGVSDALYGGFLSVTLLGMLIAPFATTGFFRKIEMTSYMAFSFAISGVLTIAQGLVIYLATQDVFRSWVAPYASLALLTILMIVFIGGCNIVISTMMQQQVPVDMMGRVSSMFGALITAAMPLGQLLTGVGLDYVNPGIIFGIGGLLALAAGGMLRIMTAEHRAALALNTIDETAQG